MSYAQDERQALVETFRDVGPDAPTLCEGWTTRDLAAHLVVRERRLDAAPGILIKALSGHTAKVQDKVAAEAGWSRLLDDIASGPPIYSPMKPVDRWANLAEYFIHHEDVLRGAADPTSDWQPRRLDPGLEKALLTPLKTMGKMSVRSLPADVSLCLPDGTVALRGGSGPAVTVTGPVGELILFATGRKPVAVTFDGDPAAIEAVKAGVHGL
ncbi:MULTISPECIES: TIGR03085 family metal-binding protein [unclassified Gordonia (in: high G+C Gram-positive bacteria)]